MEDARGEPGAPVWSRPRLLALLAVLLSTAATLLAIEAFLRIRHGALTALPSPAAGTLRMVGARYPGAHDPLLGWVPDPAASGRANPWHTTVTIEPSGVRSNGAPPPPGVPILAVGDSFTFGDEVDDAETWPAQLERMLGRPVVNGGVFGYGLDQITLRAEALLDLVPADTLIVSVIANDVLRCEFAYRYAWKPYFDVVDGALALRNVPVPEPHRGAPDEGALVRWLRRSFLADLVMRRLDPLGWPVPDSLRAHERGEAVAPLLLARLADAAAARRVALLLLVQWAPGHGDAPLKGLLAAAAARDVPVLRIEPRLRRLLAAGGVPLHALFTIHAQAGRPRAPGHMTAEGNRVVAEAVAAELRRLEDGAG
jgi:lysophospholipase L1-like esterase